MTLRIHQFSFSNYDDTKWATIQLNGGNYPSTVIDDVTHLVMGEPNISDVVVNDTILGRLQSAWTTFVGGYNAVNPGYEIAVEITPNYYGSVFIDITAVQHDAESDAVVEILAAKDLRPDTQMNALIRFGEWLLNEQKEENLCYHKFMRGTDYEELIIALCNVGEYDFDEFCSEMYDGDRDTAIERWNSMHTVLGYTDDLIATETVTEYA